MNPATSTSTLLPSRPGTDPVFGQFGGVLRTTLRALRLQWILYRAQRRKAQACEAIGEMDAHMLRDIGAPDELYARAAEQRRAHDRRGIPFGFSVALAALAVVGTLTSTSAADAAQGNPSAKMIAQAQAIRVRIARAQGTQTQVSQTQMAGVFAGEFVDGGPVYRFPAVVVTGSRKDGPTGDPPPCRQARASTPKVHG